MMIVILARRDGPGDLTVGHHSCRLEQSLHTTLTLSNLRTVDIILGHPVGTTHAQSQEVLEEIDANDGKLIVLT